MRTDAVASLRICDPSHTPFVRELTESITSRNGKKVAYFLRKGKDGSIPRRKADVEKEWIVTKDVSSKERHESSFRHEKRNREIVWRSVAPMWRSVGVSTTLCSSALLSLGSSPSTIHVVVCRIVFASWKKNS